MPTLSSFCPPWRLVSCAIVTTALTVQEVERVISTWSEVEADSVAELCGKDKTKAFVKSYFGEVDFGVCPTNEELYNFRMELNKLVKMNLEK